MLKKQLKVNNSVFLPELLQLVEKGHLVTILASGNSMRPFIEDGRDKLVFGKVENITVGDVILAEVEQGVYVCHRIETIEEGTITMRGDGVFNGTERLTKEQVRAKLVRVIRKENTYVLATSRVWKCYSAVWVSLLPLRRYLLALYRLFWLHQLPESWKMTHI